MSSEKSTPQKVCGHQSHYDLGGIRTESAIRPSPPEKKERQETGESKTPRKNPRRRIYLFVV